MAKAMDTPYAMMTLDSGESFALDRYEIVGRIVRGKIRYSIWDNGAEIQRLPKMPDVDGSCDCDSI